MLSQNDTVGLALATGAGFLVNRLSTGTKGSEQIIGGFPRSRWYASVAIQCAILLPLVVLCVSGNSSMPLREFLTAPIDRLDKPSGNYAVWYVLALFGAQARDMGMKPTDNLKIWIHHVVVMACCVGVLILSSSVVTFIAGTAILEFGSTFYNLHCLSPDDAIFGILYTTTMTGSNVCAVLLGLWFLSEAGDIPLGLRGLFVLTDVIVCLVRQMVLHKHMKQKHSKDH